MFLKVSLPLLLTTVLNTRMILGSVDIIMTCQVLMCNRREKGLVTDVKGNKKSVPYIHRSKYFIFENLYSLHFHSIITSGEKQELQVACKL